MNNRINNGAKSKSGLGAVFADRILDKAVYTALDLVFTDGAYCQKAITVALKNVDERSRPFVTSAFYGILDNNVRLDFIINGLCKTQPSPSGAIILKIGLYYLRYADMPDYAAVNRSVELSKTVPGVYSGFINAVLKKSIGFEPSFKNGSERFSYEHNAPQWFCNALVSDYGEIKAASILDAELKTKTHVRPIKGKITLDELKKSVRGEFTRFGCYLDKAESDKLGDAVTPQSLSSILAVNAYLKDIPSGSVLDLCAAPGGKSAYIYECGDYKITSCDIYPHKIELMKKYAHKTGARLNAVLNDATKPNADFVNKFDIVIADCPCSGTGTVKAKPDVLLRRKPTDIPTLVDTQNKILDVASDYCKVGGTLCYSTCSVLKAENNGVSKNFLSTHKNYSQIDEVSLFPDTDSCDGFYIARFRREV